MAKARRGRGSASKPPERGSEPGRSGFDGRAVKLLLEAVGMTQKELSELSGVHRKTLSRIANGQTALTTEIAEKLAEELHLPLHAFGEAREFLIQIDQLRRGPATLKTEGSEAPEAKVDLSAEEVAELEKQQREWNRYVEDRQVVDSAAHTFRDLLLWFLARSRGSTPPNIGSPPPKNP
ncbi:MAG TPA: helix-turn-helix transcriptional regulator [Thermoanaerobaculia bacterium]|nr:helix-turn-helix transcriptional regulator [Thermoanaerobaculia bacterium]